MGSMEGVEWGWVVWREWSGDGWGGGSRVGWMNGARSYYGSNYVDEERMDTNIN